jgi:predicted PurR-regulated permease PerM
MLRDVGGDGDEARERSDTLRTRVLAAAEHREIPIGTILATVAVVVATGMVLALAWTLRVDLILVGVAVFVAVFLAAPVAALERMGLPRALATSLVFLAGLAGFGALTYLFGSPLVSHLQAFAHQLPTIVSQAKQGNGTIGRFINWLHLHNWVEKNAPKIDQLANNLAGPAFTFGKAAFSTIVKLVLVVMLSFFLLLDMPKIWGGFLAMLPPQHADRVGRVAHEASTGVTGYVAGNAFTSLIAGLVVFVSLLIFSVPYAGLLGLWVALVDLLPVVGGLLAGVPTVLLAFLHSVSAGIGVAVIFVIYWQVENHVLNPIVMSRTVRMSKIVVLLAVMIGATLGGEIAGAFGTFIGALVGIPAGSAVQVIVRELRRGPPSDAVEGATSP